MKISQTKQKLWDKYQEIIIKASIENNFFKSDQSRIKSKLKLY